MLEALDAANAYRPASLSAPAFDDGSPLQRGGEDIELDRAEARIAAARLIATLPEREQRIITWRFFDELSQSEIAARIGISQMHVSRLLRAALRALHDEMRPVETDVDSVSDTTTTPGIDTIGSDR